MILDLQDSGGYLHFDRDQCVAAGEARAADYAAAAPYPHIVMDDFLDPALLARVAADYPDRAGRRFFDRPQERFKYQYDPNTVDSGLIRNLLAELNGEPFLAFLSAMTGIPDLISDPYFSGAGLHETLAGGHLSVHADFNVHTGMKVERRLNLLVYLNEDWDPAWGGELELWDKAMRGAAVSVAPLIGRAVVFNTTLQNFHGQPEPLRCPPDRSRRSIATYYYTALATEAAPPRRTTTFQQRPGTGDKRDWTVKYGHFVGDWVPPRMQATALKVGRKLGIG